MEHPAPPWREPGFFRGEAKESLLGCNDVEGKREMIGELLLRRALVVSESNDSVSDEPLDILNILVRAGARAVFEVAIGSSCFSGSRQNSNRVFLNSVR